MRDARADFESRRRLRRILGSRLLSLLLIGLAFLVGRAAWGMLGAYGEAAAAKVEAEDELAQLESSLAAVSGDAAALKSASGAEKRLRASLNVASPGEEVVVIVPKVASSTAAGVSARAASVWSLWGLLD